MNIGSGEGKPAGAKNYTVFSLEGGVCVLVRVSDASRVITGRFGEEADGGSVLSRRICELLYRWMPEQAPLQVLSEQIQDALFAGLKAALGESMLFHDGSRWRHVTTADLAGAADKLLGLVFDSMSETPGHYAIVREWAWRNGSLSALRCLSERFGAFQPIQEQEMIRSIWAERKQSEDAQR